MVKVRGLSGRLFAQLHAGFWPQPSAVLMQSRSEVRPVSAEARVGEHTAEPGPEIAAVGEGAPGWEDSLAPDTFAFLFFALLCFPPGWGV